MVTTAPVMRERRGYPVSWGPRTLGDFLLQHCGKQLEPAIVGPTGREWSYAELAAATAHYAATMQSVGVGHGDAVVVVLPPCPEAIAAICACSRLGAAFVPVNPGTPPARLEAIVARVSARALVGGPDAEATAGVALLRPEASRLVVIAGGTTDPGPERRVLADDVAYVVFTSGTTGAPKGIVMTHAAVLAALRAVVEHCAVRPPARVASLAPLAFDFCLLDTGLALGSGVPLVQPPRSLLAHPARLVRYLVDRQVTQFDCVPSVWELVLRYAAPELRAARGLLSTTLVAGEELRLDVVRDLRGALPALRIVNCYGATEQMFASLTDVPDDLDEVARDGGISIGLGCADAELLLLDDTMAEATEPGSVGEVYVRADSLFAGYLGDPDATAHALVANPLSRAGVGRVYRSGDLARRRHDGELTYLGRVDNQVQVHGVRVELEEIERALGRHPAVRTAAVAYVQERAGGLLGAWVLLRPGATANAADLRAFVAELLPPEMVPGAILAIEQLPLTENGKVERGAVATWLRAELASGRRPATPSAAAPA